jgi:hypothetical protein
MGSNLSTELNDKDLFPDLSLEQSITIQLRSNHYPPVPYSMVPVCIEAIKNYNDGHHGEPVELPEGVTWRGDTIAPSWAIIESHHLENWINNDEDY